MPLSENLPADLSVSIVLYNSSIVLLRRALHSLQRSAQVAREAGSVGQVDVYVVDNASNNDYRADLAREMTTWAQYDDFTVQFVQQSQNCGYGCGHNAILEQLNTEFHLVLNPDVELEQDALRNGLVALSGSDDIALLSPKVVGADGQQEFLCKRYPSVLVLLLRGFAPEFVCRIFSKRLAAYEMRDVCGVDAGADVAIASGCFMLMRTSALRAVGGFNSTFFLYFEDFDLSLRLASQGRLVFEPSMRIIHQGGYAAKKGLRHLKYFVTSGVRFFNRHGWRWM